VSESADKILSKTFTFSLNFHVIWTSSLMHKNIRSGPSHKSTMQYHSYSSSLVSECDDKLNLYPSSSGTVSIPADSPSSSSSSEDGSSRGNCSSNSEFHKLLERRLQRLLRFSTNTASTRRALKKLHLTALKAEQRMLKQNALVLQTYKEKKFALLMSKDRGPSPPLVPAVPLLADTMSSRRKIRKVSSKTSMPNPCRPDNTSCTPRKVSLACQAHNWKISKTDTPTAALMIPNDYSSPTTGSSRGPSICCSTIEATLDHQQDPLFNNEFII